MFLRTSRRSFTSTAAVKQRPFRNDFTHCVSGGEEEERNDSGNNKLLVLEFG